MQRSTRNMIKMHGWRLDRAVHNYLYFGYYDKYVVYFLIAGRWVVDRLGRYPVVGRAFKVVFDRYHAKVMTLEDMTRVLTLEEDVEIDPARLERVIPFKHANRIILEEPEFIAVMDCPCRLSRENPCQPVNVCMAVGRKTAEFWLEHGEKYHARQISQGEALDILRGGQERGEIITAWFKVATGGRFGVICTCCTCCCGALEAMRLTREVAGLNGLSNIIPSGYVVEVAPENCDDCGECVDVCMFGAITAGDGEVVQDNTVCVGCGLCLSRCGRGARSLVGNTTGDVPLDIDMLMESGSGS